MVHKNVLRVCIVVALGEGLVGLGGLIKWMLAGSHGWIGWSCDRSKE